MREILAGFESRVGIARLLFLGPGTKVGEHTDSTHHWQSGLLRLHIPIITHEDVIFMIGGERARWKEGNLYYGDFSQPHSLDNRSPLTRVHLVFDVAISPELLDLFPADTMDKIRAGTPILMDEPPVPMSDEDMKKHSGSFVAPPYGLHPKIRFPLVGQLRPANGRLLARLPGESSGLYLTPVGDGKFVHGSHSIQFRGDRAEFTVPDVYVASREITGERRYLRFTAPLRSLRNPLMLVWSLLQSLFISTVFRVLRLRHLFTRRKKQKLQQKAATGAGQLPVTAAPVNYYDRLKAHIHELQKEPSYVVFYPEHQGPVDPGIFREAFGMLMAANREKFSLRFDTGVDGWVAGDFPENPCHIIEGEYREVADFERYASVNLQTIIDENKGAPVICELHTDPASGRFRTVYYINHIYGDGGAADVLYKDHCRMYAHLMDPARPAPGPLTFHTDRSFIREYLAGCNPLQKFRHHISNRLFLGKELLKEAWAKRNLPPAPFLPRSSTPGFQVQSRILEIGDLQPKKGETSTTSLLYAAISKAMIHTLDLPWIRYGIPINLRQTPAARRAFGNHGAVQMVRLYKNQPTREMARQIHRKVRGKLIHGRCFTANQSSGWAMAKMKPEKLTRMFVRGSSGIHMLTSLFPGLGMENDRGCFPGARTLSTNGFNYPGQGNLGISLACSTMEGKLIPCLSAMNSHFSPQDFQRFFAELDRELDLLRADQGWSEGAVIPRER